MANLSYFTVVGDFLSLVEDGSDGDQNPDTMPIQGSVTFTALLNQGDLLLARTLDPRPAAVLPAKIKAVIDSDGQLKYGGQVGVRLLANTDVLELDSPLYYRVDFTNIKVKGTPVQIGTFTFEASTVDEVVNLVDVARVPGTVGQGLARGPQGLRGFSVDDVQLLDDGVQFLANGETVGTPLPLEVTTAPAFSVAVKQGDPWWDTVFAAPVADDTPTVSVSTSGLISGGTSITPTADYFGDTNFRYDGCTAVTSPGTGLVAPVQPSGGATYPIVPEFVTSLGCDKVDILFKTNSGGTAMGVRIIVNGRWLTLPLQWFTTTANTVHYIRLTFPSAKSRSIRVETTSTASFGGVVVPSGQTVSRPGREVQKRVVVIGDSYAKGANGNTTTNPATNGTSVYETFVHYVSKLLGCDSIINLAVGGTGWMDDNSGTDSTFGGRIADVLAASPHIVLAVGSRNDSAYTASQIYTAASSALGQLADIPTVEVCGPEDDGSGTTGTSAANQNEAVKQAARAAGRRFNDMIGVVTSSDKNSADGVHPSVLGAQKLAKAFYASLDRPRIDEAVAGAVGGRASVDVVLTASPSSAANSGASVTFTATLSTHRVGKVAFYGNGILLGTGTVTSAVATYTTSSLANGSYTVTARFLPANPILVKSIASNGLPFAVSANLGFVDHFTRADGAVGSTENGKAYITSGSGSYVVASNKMANPTLTGTTFCVADAGTPNGTLEVTIGGTGSTGLGANLIMRYADSVNSLNLSRSSNEIVFNKRIANTTTQVAVSTGSAIWVAGDVISVVMSGDTFTVKKNGTNVPGLTAVTCSDLNTATKHGVGTSSSGAGATFDDLQMTAA